MTWSGLKASLAEQPVTDVDSLFALPTGLLGHHPDQPVAVAVYGAVCAITRLCSFVLRWYASFGGRLMKKEIAETKLRRDRRRGRAVRSAHARATGSAGVPRASSVDL